MSPDDQPIVITRPEFMRRMMEMQAMQGMGMGSADLTSFINKSLNFVKN